MTLSQRFSAQLLAIASVAASISLWAQPTEIPRATVRELATIEEMVKGYPVLMPNRRVLIYTPFADGATLSVPRDGDDTFAYDTVTRRRTLLGTNMITASVSPQGDRLAFDRSSEDGATAYLWTMPIDPQTGVATGPAQRVSLRPKNPTSAKFSPDGRMLVFNAGPRADGTWDLTIVPARGGAERVVANYARPGSQTWSADGTSLYVGFGANVDAQTAVERVTVADGRREAFVPRPPFYSDNRVGLSPDGRVSFFLINPDRFFFRTAAGVVGEISVPLTPPTDWGSGRDMTLDSLRYTTMTHVFNQRVRILDLATGRSRELLPGHVQSGTPAWSPDGRRVAVLTGSLSHYDITVVNADGSSPRRYPVPMHVDGYYWPVWENPWSPDGRFLAFSAETGPPDVQKAAYDPSERKQLVLLEVASGETRVLATSSEGIVKFVWRADSLALRVLRRKLAPISPARFTTVEIPLAGPERPLRDISSEFPNLVLGRFDFVSDRAVVLTTITGDKTDRYLVPFGPGPARRLPDPGTEVGLRPGGILVAGERLLVSQLDERGEARAIKLVSMADGATTTLRPPLSMPYGRVFEDGRQMVSIGKVAGESANKLFIVPLDGTPTRVVGEIPYDPQSFISANLVVPSPDGTRLAYTAAARYTTKIFEIDFAPALPAILKR